MSAPARLLVVTADDYGLTEPVSRAILDAHLGGVVTAASVLVNAPAAAATMPWLVDHPDLEPGLHLALVGEDPPVSPTRLIPTLVDRRGRLARSWTALLPRLLAGRVDPADVRREAEAQLAALRAAGVEPRHLSTHQHVHLWPSVGAVVRDLARVERIAFVRTPRARRRGARGVALGPLSTRLARDLAADGLATTDAYLGLDEAGGFGVDRLRAGLGRIGAAASVEVNLHPGHATDPARARYRWGYDWAGDLATATDPSTRRAIAAAGFALARPTDLH